MPAVRHAALALIAALVGAPLLLGAPAAAQVAPITVTKTTLHFATLAGPDGQTPCEVEGDLYVPSTATEANPAPAILTTNGFGGDKNDGGTQGNASFALQYAKQGYVALSYSGLGFGNSGCLIRLDDPDWDGKAASQLVSFLGGDTGIGFTGFTPSSVPNAAGTYTGPTTVDVVQKDATDHAGVARTDDPRVGMIGGSYGGEVQLAVAGIDKRVDTIIPQITWNDLSYSLAPNNATQAPGTVTYATPGVEKQQWVSLFFGVGLGQAATSPGGNAVQCGNFPVEACRAKAQMDAVGYPDAGTLSLARHASVSTYLDTITIPVFLSQGQSDTLFNLQEAAATYRGLKARGVPVKMLWQFWGHSDSTPKPGELDATKDPSASFLGQRYLAWFDHYLKDLPTDTGPEFEYFRDYVPYAGNGQPGTATAAGAAGAYGSAPAYPVAPATQLFLSGDGALVADRRKIVAGSTPIVTSTAPATSYTETSALDQSQPVTDAPGTFAAFSTEALTTDAELVGSPTLTVKLAIPDEAVAAADPGAGLVLFVKLYDVAPDGTIVLPHRLIAPVRVQDVSKPVTVALPGVVTKVRAGHTLRLVLAQGDAAYKGNTTARTANVVLDPATPSVLTLPTIVAADPNAEVPEVPYAALLPLVALGIAGAVVVRRRRS